MKKIRAVKGISFADASFKHFYMSENRDLTVYLSSWQDLPLKIEFTEAIQFSFKGGGFVKEMYEITESSSFLAEAIELTYENVPLEHSFIHFQIEDIDDFPFIEVVAKAVHVRKES